MIDVAVGLAAAMAAVLVAAQGRAVVRSSAVSARLAYGHRSAEVLRSPWWTRRVASMRRERSARRIIAGLPDWLDALAGEARSGAPLSAALWSAESGSLADEMVVLRREVGSGGSLVPALRAWADRWKVAELDLVVASLVMAVEAGGEIAATCERCAAFLRDGVEVADEIRSLTSQSRASAGLMTVLPLCSGALMTLIDPATARFLMTTPAGWACCGFALSMDVAGWRWMRRLSRSVR